MSIKEQLRATSERNKEVTGQELMDTARFMENTRHMIVFDVLKWECPVGDKGKRIRIFLSDDGYKQAIESEERGELKIVRHASICKGKLFFNAQETILE